MLDSLKFVQGAIATKDFVPSLKHFHISNNTIQGSNGVITLNASIPLNIDCSPKAVPLVQAISNCNEATEIKLSKDKLNIRSGSFKANIPCLNEPYMPIQPSGTFIPLDGEMLVVAFKTLYPLIGTDAARPWSNGVLLKNGSLFTTNNVIAAKSELGPPSPFVANIPSVAVREVLRIKEPPTTIQLSETHITFHYGENKWLTSSLYANEWPDLASLIGAGGTDILLSNDFFNALEALQNFSSDINEVYFSCNGMLSTSFDPENSNASFSIPEMNFEAVYNLKMLQLLKGAITHLDLSPYPNPGFFQGPNLKGVIIGMRMPNYA